MWNVVQICGNNSFTLRGYDKRPLRFTEKAYADRLAHELTVQNESEYTKYVVVKDESK